MVHNSSGCLRTASLTFRISLSPKSVLTNPKCLTFPSLLKPQTRHLSTRHSARQIHPICLISRTRATVTDQAHSASRTLSIRFATTSASPSTSTTGADASSPSTDSKLLTWDGYLSLRQKRRYYNVIASSLTALGTFAGGASFLMAQDIDKISGVMLGIDPIIAMGIVCLGFGAVGWLMGPFAGGFLFRLTHRRVAGTMETKEKDFYRRIKKYRSDPTGQSVSNPVPDYYGEKIFSVRGYRQWLKDQRAFKKKRETLT